MPPHSAIPDIHRPVKVFLKDLNSRENIPNRTVFLLPPTYEISIGRGSQAEPNLHAQEWNAWFGSRVMSREHAWLRADPETKQVFVEDAGSMHGTYVNNIRLEPDQAQPILENDTVQLGTEIVRGDQTYKPLVLSIRADFYENVDQMHSRNPVASSHVPKNTFTIDYSEEEDDDDDDDDVEVLYESLRVPSSEPDRQSRTFSVPDSDLSDSDIEPSMNKESAPSSPEERSEKMQNLAPPSQLNSLVSQASEFKTRPNTTLPGSSMQNALDVSDDEDQEHNNGDESTAADMLAASISSEEYPYSTDEDADSDVDEAECETDCGMYGDDDVQEEQSIDEMENQNSGTSQSQAHQETAPRSPSPSDCALPKPSWYPANNLPATQNSVELAPWQRMMFPGNFTVESSQTSPYQHFPPYPTMPWMSSESVPVFAGPVDQLYNPSSLPPFQQNIIKQPDHCFPGPLAETLPPVENVSLVTNENGPTKQSKVSINDIIDDVSLDPMSTNIHRKRKADEISTMPAIEEDVEASEPEDSAMEASLGEDVPQGVLNTFAASSTLQSTSEISSSNEIVPERSSPVKKSVTFSATPVVIETQLERPHKKARTQPKDKSGSFLKYFAAAVGGATFGAVGTVFGLAALPSGYFS